MQDEKKLDCGCEHGHHEQGDNHQCGCNCDEDVEMIYLTLNDGKDLACEVLAIFEMEDKKYIALLPEGSEDVYLYGYGEDEEGPILSQIEKDEEYEMVSEAFLSLCE